MIKFIIKQINDIKNFGIKEFFRKFYLFLKILLKIPIYTIAVIPCIIIRLLSPWLIIRIERISGDNYAEFANDPK